MSDCSLTKNTAAQIAEVLRRDEADTGEMFSNEDDFAKLDSVRPSRRDPPPK